MLTRIVKHIVNKTISEAMKEAAHTAAYIAHFRKLIVYAAHRRRMKARVDSFFYTYLRMPFEQKLLELQEEYWGREFPMLEKGNEREVYTSRTRSEASGAGRRPDNGRRPRHTLRSSRKDQESTGAVGSDQGEVRS